MNLEKIDPVLKLLFAGMVLFTAVLIGVTWFFKDDGQIFQVVSALVSGLAGSFFTRLKPAKTEPMEQAESTTVTKISPIDPPAEPK